MFGLTGFTRRAGLIRSDRSEPVRDGAKSFNRDALNDFPDAGTQRTRGAGKRVLCGWARYLRI